MQQLPFCRVIAGILHAAAPEKGRAGAALLLSPRPRQTAPLAISAGELAIFVFDRERRIARDSVDFRMFDCLIIPFRMAFAGYFISIS